MRAWTLWLTMVLMAASLHSTAAEEETPVQGAFEAVANAGALDHRCHPWNPERAALGPVCPAYQESEWLANAPLSRAGTTFCDPLGDSFEGGCLQWEATFDHQARSWALGGIASMDDLVFIGAQACAEPTCGQLAAVLQARDLSTGALAWEQRPFSGEERGYVRGIAVTSEQVVMAGEKRCPPTDDCVLHGYMNAYSLDGTPLWEAASPYGANSSGAAQSVAADASHVYLAGQRCGDSHRCPTEAFVAAFSATDGAPEWFTIHERGDDVAFGSDVVVDAGRVYFIGSHSCDGSCASTPFLLALDANDGTVLWHIHLEDDGARISPATLAVDGDQVYLSGYATSCDSLKRDCRSYHAFLRAYATATGEHLWTSRYPGLGYDALGTGVAVAGSRAYLVGLDRDNQDAWDREAFIVAYDTHDGQEVWAARHADEVDYSFAFGASATDDRVVMAGFRCDQQFCPDGTEGFAASYSTRGDLLLTPLPE